MDARIVDGRKIARVTDDGKLKVLVHGRDGDDLVPVKVSEDGYLMLATDVTVEGVTVDLSTVELNQGAPGQNPWPVTLSGTKVAEHLTEADAVANVLTFSAPIGVIEIYHESATRQAFTVNNITLYVPPGYYRTPVDGVPSAEVTIPAGVSCIVGRLV